jgi:succinate dehydrogenase/fumarate reductase flavoprotein subunit
LAGNALSECLVFGKKAGRNASIAALVEEAPVIDNGEFERVLRKYNGTMDSHEKSASFLKKRLRDIAWLHLGVIRNASSIMESLEKLEQIKRGLEDLGKAGDTNELIMGMEVRNLAFVGEMIANAALMRTESRGQHFREDYPEKDDAKWMKWLVLHKGKKGGVWSTVQVPKNE